MNVLVMFERSGVVRRAFRAAGHAAYSVDLAPSADNSPHHEQTDAWELAGYPHWDLIIAHPPCTFLCSSGLHRNVGNAARESATRAAVAEVRRLLAIPAIIARHRGADAGRPVGLCVENPVGRIGTEIRPADQYVQPYQFGHDASKRTGLWLLNLPPLTLPPATTWIAPRMVTDAAGRSRPRWANQTDSGQNRLPPHEGRAMDRARTYEGLAAAMAAQWGGGPTLPPAGPPTLTGLLEDTQR